MKTALIIGHTGQDGTLLTELLLKLQFKVAGVSSNGIFTNFNSGFIAGDISDPAYVSDLIREIQPDEIYYLAAVHQSSADKKIDDHELFQKSYSINTLSLLNVLNSIKEFQPNCRLFYAASSHIFGNVNTQIQDEETPLNPNGIYGITKTAGVHTCHFYRDNHNIFASIGIFYNHESPLRSSKFVSKKIVEGAIAIKNKSQGELVLGDLSATIDWGYAPDYVDAAYRILQVDKPGDFIIASGKSHTVKEFVEHVFEFLNLDWQQYVKVNPQIITKQNMGRFVGDATKLRELTGWKPSVSFKEMTHILVDAELKKQNLLK